MQIEEKDNGYKISVPLIDNTELKNINNNFEKFKIVKMFPLFFCLSSKIGNFAPV